jgi:hypothetical protein
MTTLLTPTPADGQQLARKLAGELIAAHTPAGSFSMPAMLSTSAPARPDVCLITAIYFHAISVANNGWRPAK